jgi:hypothetical protein
LDSYLLRLCRLAVRKGSAFPFHVLLFIGKATPCHARGVASRGIKQHGRKGKAFPHSAAAEPLKQNFIKPTTLIQKLLLSVHIKHSRFRIYATKPSQDRQHLLTVFTALACGYFDLS